MKKHYPILPLLLIVFFASAQYSWINKDTFPGISRSCAAGFSINGTGYLVGGYTNYPNTAVNEVWAYNPTSDSWTQKGNFPAIATGPGYFSIGNFVYVCGGGLGNSTNSSATYQYNPATDTWTPKSNFPGNGISGAFQFVINGLGYIGTGERNGANTSTSMYSYNPTTDSWASLAPYPGGSVVNSVGFAIDSFGYAGLGGDGGTNLSNSFYKYSPTSNTWAAIAAFPGETRSSAMAFVINGKAYVGGGWTTIPGSSSTYNLGDFYEYDPANNSWAAVPGLPGRGKHNGSSFTIDNNAYIICGYDFYTAGNVSNVSEFGTCSELTGLLPVPGNQSNAAGVEIYPNPSNNTVSVKINSQVNTEAKYEVVSIDGKILKTGTTLQSTFGFNTNNLADGVYILNITDNQGTHGSQRFEVMH